MYGKIEGITEERFFCSHSFVPSLNKYVFIKYLCARLSAALKPNSSSRATALLMHLHTSAHPAGHGHGQGGHMSPYAQECPHLHLLSQHELLIASAFSLNNTLV